MMPTDLVQIGSTVQSTSPVVSTLPEDGTLPSVVRKPVTCPEDSLVLLHYPWKRKPMIRID